MKPTLSNFYATIYDGKTTYSVSFVSMEDFGEVMGFSSDDLTHITEFFSGFYLTSEQLVKALATLDAQLFNHRVYYSSFEGGDYDLYFVKLRFLPRFLKKLRRVLRRLGRLK